MMETESGARELAVDYVSCELMLETAKACSSLRSSLDRIDVELADGETQVDLPLRHVRRKAELVEGKPESPVLSGADL